MCQLKNIHEFAEKNTWVNNVFQSRVRILRTTKRNIKYLINKTISLFVPKINRPSVTDIKQHNILPGELVKIRSKEEIRGMLDNWEKYKGCLFIDEMYEYCGKTYKVLKEEQHFFDEVKQKMCKCKNIVILEGVLCSGRQRLFVESCDRACFFFWHKDWLKKI